MSLYFGDNNWLTRCGGWQAGDGLCSALYSQQPFVFRTPATMTAVDGEDAGSQYFTHYKVLRVGSDRILKAFRVVGEAGEYKAVDTASAELRRAIERADRAAGADAGDASKPGVGMEDAEEPAPGPESGSVCEPGCDSVSESTPSRYCQVNCAAMSAVHPDVCVATVCGAAAERGPASRCYYYERNVCAHERNPVSFYHPSRAPELPPVVAAGALELK